MANFDLVVGADVDGLNTISKQAFKAFYPKYFTGSEKPKNTKYVRVEYYIDKPPTFSLQSKATQPWQAIFALNFSSIKIRGYFVQAGANRDQKLHHDDFECTCVVDIGLRSIGTKITIKMIKLTPNPTIPASAKTLLTNGINKFLSGFKVPPITIPGIKFADQKYAVVGNCLLVATAMKGVATFPVSFRNLQPGRQFAFIGAPILNSVIGAGIKKFHITFRPKSGKLKSIALAVESARISIPTKGVQAATNLKLAMKTTIPLLHNIRLNVSCRVVGSVVGKNKQVLYKVVDVRNITINGLPTDWLPLISKPIINAITHIFLKLLPPIPIANIPEQAINFNDLVNVVVQPTKLKFNNGKISKIKTINVFSDLTITQGVKPGKIGSADVKHVVVLMLENRSFDNLLGWLYEKEHNQPSRNIPESTPPTFAGLVANTYYNKDGTKKHYVTPQTKSFCTPNPDPEEQFRFMNEQIFGSKDMPKENEPATMSGFVQDYKNKSNKPEDIMSCYSPAQTPVLSGLARNFAVCDRWFASAPCQTWPNRSFVHAGTSCGRINNLDKSQDDNTPPNPMYYKNAKPIFEVFQHIGVSWKIYTDTLLPSLTRYQFAVQLLNPALQPNFRHIDDFEKDAHKGTLPLYSFVEPKFMEVGDQKSKKVNSYHPPYNVALGETFVARIYNALQKNEDTWKNTLFIITFDEHGGCYDHEPPPWGAIRPDASPAQKEKYPFTFNRYGVRVPTILVSPFIEPGTVFRAPAGGAEYDHTSILTTLLHWVDKKGVTKKDWMNSKRVQQAPRLDPVLTRSSPRTDKPQVALPKNPGSCPEGNLPLDDIHRGLLAAQLMEQGVDYETAAKAISSIHTTAEIPDFLRCIPNLAL
jgi:phospholipase C